MTAVAPQCRGQVVQGATGLVEADAQVLHISQRDVHLNVQLSNALGSVGKAMGLEHSHDTAPLHRSHRMQWSQPQLFAAQFLVHQCIYQQRLVLVLVLLLLLCLKYFPECLLPLQKKAVDRGVHRFQRVGRLAGVV